MTKPGGAIRQLVRQGGIYATATALQLVAGILVLPVLTRLLSVQEFGRVALAVVLVQLLGAVFTAGLPTVISREFFSAAPDAEAAATRAVVLSGLIAVLLGASAFSLGSLWGRALNGYDGALQLATIAAVAFAMTQAVQALFRSRQQLRQFLVVALIPVAIGQPLGLALCLVWKSASAYLLGVTLSQCLGTAIGVAWASPFHIRGWCRKELAAWFSIALPTIPHMLAMYSMVAGGRLVVEAMAGGAAVAAYSVAYAVGGLGVVLVNAANNAWAPLIYSAHEERWSVLASTTQIFFRYGAMLSVVIAMGSPYALAVLAPAGEYDIQGLSRVASVLAFATLPVVGYLSSAHVVFWLGKTRSLMWITPAAAGLNIFLAVWLLPEFGLTGVVIAVVAAYSLLALLLQWRQRRLATVPWSGRAIPLVCAGMGCALAAALPYSLLGHSVRTVSLSVIAVIFLRGSSTFIARRHIQERR